MRELYDEVLIPQAVYEEFVATERAVHQAALENAPWIRPVSLANPQRARVYIGLDLGEREPEFELRGEEFIVRIHSAF